MTLADHPPGGRYDRPTAARRHHTISARTRRRRLLAAVVVATSAVAGIVAYSALTEPSIVIPDDPCAQRPPLRNVDGVRLQPVAMKAFLQAQRDVDGAIEVVQSYRSCAEQRRACRSICGNPEGCPDLCAPPGLSWHQLGAAVDISQASLDRPGVVQALEDRGWCQSVPATDPGHFSYDGCH